MRTRTALAGLQALLLIYHILALATGMWWEARSVSQRISVGRMHTAFPPQTQSKAAERWPSYRHSCSQQVCSGTWPENWPSARDDFSSTSHTQATVPASQRARQLQRQRGSRTTQVSIGSLRSQLHPASAKSMRLITSHFTRPRMQLSLIRI